MNSIYDMKLINTVVNVYIFQVSNYDFDFIIGNNKSINNGIIHYHLILSFCKTGK